MKIGEVQEFDMENEVHLCLSCRQEHPGCNPENVIHGTGAGNDNIVACCKYKPIELRHPKHNGVGQI